MPLIHKDLSYTITGILFEVHNDMGRFAGEKEVCDCIEIKLKEHPIPYCRELVLPHAGQVGRNRIDFLIDNKIVLEIKNKRYLTREDYYQIQRYLHSLNMALGLLVNFGEERLSPKRILNSTGKE